MVDEYQVEYEYSAGLTLSIKTASFKPRIIRPHLRVRTAVDGTRIVTDSGVAYLQITATAYMSGSDLDALHAVQTAAITYTGDYPRLKKIYWAGASTETNYEVALVDVQADDLGAGWWLVTLTFEGKNQ